MKDEVVKGWDHVYNISEDYIHLTAEGELGWCSARSASSDSEDVLENWKHCMHEVSFRKCGIITLSLRHVATEIVELPIYERILELSRFLKEFEVKVIEPQCLLALGEALKATLARWWEAHKEKIHEWAQCRRLMTVRFGDMEVYHTGRYDGQNDPCSHLRECHTLWASQPKDEWVHAFIHTLDEMPRSWYISTKLHR